MLKSLLLQSVRDRVPVAAASCLTIMLALFAPSVNAQQPPAHLDVINRTLWSDDKLGLRFTYPSVWQPALATQSSTRTVINWRLAKSKALLATCYVETHGPETSSLALLDPSKLHENAESIAKSSLRNFQKRAPDGRLIESRPTVHDGHPVIYLVREGTMGTFDRKSNIKAYSLQTVWRKNEVNFECATSIFGPEYTSIEGGQRIISQVEEGILHVLRTLQFDRVR